MNSTNDNDFESLGNKLQGLDVGVLGIGCGLTLSQQRWNQL